MILENQSPYDKPKDGYERLSERSALRRSTAYSGLGKLPPQVTDLEEAVLGALLLEKDAFLTVNSFLLAEHFYKDAHQKIFYAMGRLFYDGKPLDILTITQQLRQQGELEMIGGAYYITELTNRVVSAANIEVHARIVFEKFLQRELIRIGTDTINSAYEDTTDVLELIEATTLRIFHLMSEQHGKQDKRLGTMIDDCLAELDTPAVGGLTGVGTGFKPLNDFNAGWQKGELTILAARPAMGKTALMMQWVRNAAVIHDVPVGVFSLEMSESQITKRMIASETEIFLEKINKKTIHDWERHQIETRLAKLRNAKIFIDDEPAITTTAFRSKCIRMKKKYDIGLFVVDYLQLMRGEMVPGQRGGNREQEIGMITRALKGIAKELDVPVIALSQLSRASESRPGGGNKPKLSDLRESGNIEQDADNVYFLYRPAYYGLTKDEEGRPTDQMAELINAKHRNGATGTTFMKFRGAVMRFEDWDTHETLNLQPTVTVIAPPEEFVIKPAPADEELPF